MINIEINRIIKENKDRFIAEVTCENCYYTRRMEGFNDINYLLNVFPKLNCKHCGESTESLQEKNQKTQ